MNLNTSNKLRRSEFDWLRVLAFGILIFFHTGMLFVHWDWQATYSRDRIGLMDATYREDLWGLNIGIRGGYRFMFGKPENHYGGYTTFWVALMYKTHPQGPSNMATKRTNKPFGYLS